MRTSYLVRRTPQLATKGERSFTVRFPEICLGYLLFVFLVPFFPSADKATAFFMPFSWHFLTRLTCHGTLGRDKGCAFLGEATSQLWDARNGKASSPWGWLPWCLCLDFIFKRVLKSEPLQAPGFPSMKGWEGEATKHWPLIDMQQGFKTCVPKPIGRERSQGKSHRVHFRTFGVGGGRRVSCRNPGSIYLLKRFPRLTGQGEQIWWWWSFTVPLSDRETHRDSFQAAFQWSFTDNTDMCGLRIAGIQKRRAINRGTSADRYWRNHHLHLARRSH